MRCSGCLQPRPRRLCGVDQPLHSASSGFSKSQCVICRREQPLPFMRKMTNFCGAALEHDVGLCCEPWNRWQKVHHGLAATRSAKADTSATVSQCDIEISNG